MKATKIKCMDTPNGKTAIYVMTAQNKLVQKLAEAAKCPSQDFHMPDVAVCGLGRFVPPVGTCVGKFSSY